MGRHSFRSNGKARGQCYWIDPAERSIKVAKIHAEKSNSDVNYLCGSSETLAKSMYESYDVVTCMEMLEHVTSPEKEIEACSSLLKSGGR